MILFLLLFAFLLESTVTSIPLVLSIVLILYITQKKSWVFWAAFILGLLLDTVYLKPLGQTSIFLISFLFIASLYESKFETSSNFFVLVYSFLGSIFFLWIFGSNAVFLQGAVSSIIALLVFMSFKSAVFNFKDNNR